MCDKNVLYCLDSIPAIRKIQVLQIISLENLSQWKNDIHS